jgi:predicted permease
MSLFGRMKKRVRAAAARSRLEREMQDEMQEHIDRAAERFRDRGLSEADALLAARREFGNVGVTQEQARDARGARWIESVLGDIRYAARQIRRTPLLAATIVLTLTLAIGVGAAAIGTVSGVWTRPAPGVPDDKALVAIRGLLTNERGRAARLVSYPELMDYARQSVFKEVAGSANSLVVVEVAGQPAGSSEAYFVTPNFFHALGLRIGGGPGFSQTRVDDHSTPELTAVIARLYARERFGVEDEAVGKTIRVNGVNVRIVGVAPPRFIGTTGDGGHRVIWMPVSAWQVIDRQADDALSDRGRAEFSVVGRLRDDGSTAAVTPGAELVASRARSAVQSGDKELLGTSWSADVIPLRGNLRLQSNPTDDVIAVGMIIGAVILILLVCTTTVSSLLVGASVLRRHEIAVRLALGASRRRIVRQLLTESALLAGVAAVTGLTAFALISRSLHDSITDLNFDPSWTTALLTAAFALTAAVLCGLSPALHATRDAVAGVLKDSATNSTARSRLQRVFVVAQIALTQPLLLGLAVAVAVVMRQGGQGMKNGLNERVVRARFEVWTAAARTENKLPVIMQRIRALPGVTAVLPVFSGARLMDIGVPATGKQVRARTKHVAPGYFSAMDIRLLRGREFVDADTLPRIAPVIIGNDFATQAFGDADPIGKRIASFASTGQRIGEVEVIGVVAAADVGDSEGSDGIRLFAPNGGVLSRGGASPDGILIRTTSLAAPMIPTFRAIAAAEAPLTPIMDIQTLAQIEEYTRSEIVEAASAAAVGGIITLFLASIGLYAVVALGVGQRRREIGVRISLGARPSQVVAMFFRGGLRVSLLGLAIGLPLSAAVLAVVGSQVGMPRANLPLIAAAVAIIVVIVASLASWIPARRAAGVDPLVALRDG